MQTHEALAALGVTEQTLSPAEKEHLDQNGYLPLPNILSAELVARINTRMDELIALEGAEAGKEVHQEAGTTRLSDLVNKDPVFEICFTHPRVLAAIAHVLGDDLRLSSLNYRAALPGFGHQGLHADWGGAVPPGEYSVCNSVWLLDDFTALNGATRVVPGSNRSGTSPKDVMADPVQPHPDEVLLTAPAGTVVIFNAHTWHGGTLNRTDKPRRSITAYYCRREVAPFTDQRKHMRPETRAKLSEAALVLLDAE